MNFHSDTWILNRVAEHYADACRVIPENQIIGVFYQGSGNYGMDYQGSDVDTKCICLPSIQELHDNKMRSETYVRENDEHMDFKDIRLMLDLFRKQNANYLETLFTDYYKVNPLYEKVVIALRNLAENIVEMDLHTLIKSLTGIANEKYFAMEHHYPSRMHMINEWGYDPKQLHHLIRIDEFMTRFIAGESFRDCLKTKMADHLINVKIGWFNLDDARKIANQAKAHIDKMYGEHIGEKSPNYNNINNQLYNISYNAINEYIKYNIER